MLCVYELSIHKLYFEYLNKIVIKIIVFGFYFFNDGKTT